MILPASQLSVLLLLVLSLVCWGSWINTLKAARGWRFEYFYYDFTCGTLLTALVLAFTLGSMNSQELTFEDNFLLAAYHKIAWAGASGIVFNLGNLFLVAGVALSGVSVAFPIAFGIALAVDAGVGYASHPQGSIILLFVGITMSVAAVVATVLAHQWYIEERLMQGAPLRPDPRYAIQSGRASAPGPMRGIVMSTIGGLLLSVFFPMLTEATSGETGVASYGAIVLIAGGVLLSSLFLVPFFLVFPVTGVHGRVRGYFKGEKKQHLLGLAGGILWMAGLAAGLVANGAAAPMLPGQVTHYFLAHAGFLLAAVWGMLAWREFRGASYRVGMILTAVGVLFLVGLGIFAISVG